MFRNPREGQIDTGRPPTPPRLGDTPKMQSKSPYFNGATTPISSTPKLVGSKKKPLMSGNSRSKPNASILNFFQKAPPTPSNNGSEVEGLFFKEKDADTTEFRQGSRERSLSPSRMFLDGGVNLGDGSMIVDEESPLKKRKLFHNSAPTNIDESSACTPPPTEYMPPDLSGGDGSHDKGLKMPRPKATYSKPKRIVGGFVDESDSEDEEVGESSTEVHTQDASSGQSLRNVEASAGGTLVATHTEHSPPNDDGWDSRLQKEESPNHVTQVPTLKQESTSMFDPGEFDEDFDEEEFYEQGEEYLERRWMQEQHELEMGLDNEDDEDSSETNLHASRSIETNQHILVVQENSETVCPVCGGSLFGVSETEASQHVNSCLDGKPTPLPSQHPKPCPVVNSEPPQPKSRSQTPTGHGSKRFQRAAIARPAQENPFSLSSDRKSTSAFSRLMSGHAEDAAWAVAAANEAKSRGKQAWDRTCPFYKILPGFFICVDGFRYGKVEGCNAYFLSHFHSDHYIGMTASWCHGPIYCSKVTANLCRQQLKVDPKWLRPLDWEQTVEVPDTNGVSVTMIPANHCPGSSLFLFEKVAGKGTNPRKQRVLHCGDFRACPAHVNHPLLRPDVFDKITGKTRQQMIDVCYLDTTYLTPKYAFPPQEDVIGSCAQMCASMSKELVDLGDAWEQVKRERAGSGMVKFLGKEPKLEEDLEIVKQEDGEDIKPKVRGRLLVVIGTYSIGKERICLGIARALKSKIYAPPSKQRICLALEDPELASLLTSDPLEAQIHMQMLMEIRAETLADYLQTFKPHFSRVVGFRPTGWNYRPPTSRFTENPAVNTVLTSDGWRSRFSMKDLVPQRGSTKESNCFGVPYSEHSSFRDLTIFCCALRIGKVIPTVNVGSKKSRERMKMWVEKWEAEKKKNGLFKVEEGLTSW